MERQEYTTEQTERFEALQQSLREQHPEWETPCPGSRLKLGDDVAANNRVYRVLWGEESDETFTGLIFDFAGMPMREAVEIGAITDRAPADPLEEPLPIFEEPP